MPRRSRCVWARDSPEKRDQGGALFEAIAEFAPTPVFLGQRRSPEAKRRDPDSRVAFSLPTFFWRSKSKVGCHRATPGQQANAKPANPEKPKTQVRATSSTTQRVTTGGPSPM